MVMAKKIASDWQLDFLVDYIINNHHQYVRRMIPVISLHADKVASVHGKNHPETLRIADLFLAVREELEGAYDERGKNFIPTDKANGFDSKGKWSVFSRRRLEQFRIRLE